ncbi:hypothetical protein CMO92_04205 [Candidatus Woesearchaeota archaeon]|nr:hypothetical protein [Candidatus Woesearchaeota archaeon]|tara:strand:+ start:258 stop:635 length:378 start_codon:yes stop_codon:yes gene_type:complete
MEKKVCLDSDISIEIIKKTEKGITFINLVGESEAYISTISQFELLLRKHNIEPVERFIRDLNILPFTDTCARKAAELLKELQSKGESVDIRDLFIAATAITNNCALATLNTKHFKKVPGIRLVQF